jgi:hypothetical protein
MVQAYAKLIYLNSNELRSFIELILERRTSFPQR